MLWRQQNSWNLGKTPELLECWGDTGTLGRSLETPPSFGTANQERGVKTGHAPWSTLNWLVEYSYFIIFAFGLLVWTTNGVPFWSLSLALVLTNGRPPTGKAANQQAVQRLTAIREPMKTLAALHWKPLILRFKQHAINQSKLMTAENTRMLLKYIELYNVRSKCLLYFWL